MKGLVLNPNGTVVPGAEMRIKGREQMTFKSSEYGEYWRLLLPGVHTIQVSSKLQDFYTRFLGAVASWGQSWYGSWIYTHAISAYRH